jgi:F-type H+-transporting ATPase subunit b
MKRLACLAIMLGLAVLAPLPRAGAQERPEAAPAAADAGGHQEKEPAFIWKVANFLLLFGALGYLVAKNAPAFFAARSRKIEMDMADARKLRGEAAARTADVERRLANLEADIAAMRAESQAATAAEAGRVEKHTAAEIVKIEAHAQREIESAGKAARMELKRYAVQMAIDLAERKIRARMTPEIQDGLVRGFVRDLEKPPSGAPRN